MENEGEKTNPRAKPSTKTRISTLWKITASKLSIFRIESNQNVSLETNDRIRLICMSNNRMNCGASSVATRSIRARYLVQHDFGAGYCVRVCHPTPFFSTFKMQMHSKQTTEQREKKTNWINLNPISCVRQSTYNVLSTEFLAARTPRAYLKAQTHKQSTKNEKQRVGFRLQFVLFASVFCSRSKNKMPSYGGKHEKLSTTVPTSHWCALNTPQRSWDT